MKLSFMYLENTPRLVFFSMQKYCLIHNKFSASAIFGSLTAIRYTAYTAKSIQKQLTRVQHLTFFIDGYGILRQKKRR